MRIIEAPTPFKDPGSSTSFLANPALAPSAMPTSAVKKSFKKVQFESREQAILEATNRLLSEKGYEQMVMDDIATEVGIAKGSLYRHFQSKEDLAAAVMLQLLKQTHQVLQSLSERPAINQLESLLEWILKARLKGQVPHLPSASIQLRAALMGHKDYMNALMALSEDLGQAIVRAKSAGRINAQLADEFVLYHFYSRACDPTLEYLKSGGSMSDELIVNSMVRVTFDGLNAP
jgi:AcrR family transcriptional regulator